MRKNTVKILIAFLLLGAFVITGFSNNGAEAYSKKSDFYAVNAAAVSVIERSSGRVLYEQNSHKKLPMASTTKIMTCITAIENCDDVNKTVTVPQCAQGVEGSSIYLQAGEKQKFIDLLYGLMLQSGNDCAVTIACAVGGSVEGFAKLMNETAIKAGAENTNFTNPHGLPDDNHYTTSSDLAKISAYAMNNPIFRKIVSTKKHTMPWDGREYNRILLNKNKILNTVDGGCGIKTGFTKKAGRCLVSCASRNGMDVICVVLNCPQMFEDSKRLLNTAFDNYELCNIVDNASVAYAKVNGGKQKSVALAPEKSFSYPLRSDEKNKIEIEIDNVTDMKARVKKGEKNGEIRVLLEKRLLFSSDLYTIYNVESSNLWDKLKELLQN